MVNLKIDYQQTKTTLIEFIFNEITGAGFSRAVIGLSGGIDSSLSCYLTAESLGPENVLAIRMPYTTSSTDSLEHAQLVIDSLGVQSRTIPIAEFVDPLFKCFPDAGRIRKGNIMARSRMIILYDQSAAFEGLVIGTGNKTEILLGYTTLYGDSACALNPIGDLYKTQVRQLAHEIGVPKEIIEKPPSADLWTGQTDEDELGFSYSEVDELLYLLVDEQLNPQECIAQGYKEGFVNKVVERIRRYRFKRIMPPIAKLSNSYTDFDIDYLKD
jgi:NAD+ synthase